MLTAMTVTPEDTVQHLARAAEERRRMGEARARAMSARLAEVARVLRGEFGATTVVLFGSVARGDARADCDLDLAVGGLSAVDAARARGRLGELLPWDVDLVRLEIAQASLRQRIADEGQPL